MRKVWGVISLFIVLLVVSMPVASAVSFGSLTTNPQLLKVGDTATATVELSDVHPAFEPNVTVDATAISNELFPKAMVCTDLGNFQWKCEVQLTNFKPAYPAASITIEASDALGTWTQTYPLTVYEPVAETPEFFTLNQTLAIPATLDRTVAKKIGQIFFIKPILSTPTGAPQILNQEIDCSEAPLLSGEPLFITKGTQPLIRLRTTTNVPDEAENLSVSCTFSMQVLSEGKMYALPEIEQVNVQIPIHTNSMGEPEDVTQQKIDSVHDEIDKLQEKIDKWEGWNKLFAYLCTIAETIGRIDQVLQGLKPVIAAVACVTIEFGGNSIWEGYCFVANLFESLAHNFFWPRGYLPTTSTILGVDKQPAVLGWIVKYVCIIYTCRLWEFLTQMVVGLGASALAGLFESSEQESGETKKNDDGSTTTTADKTVDADCGEGCYVAEDGSLWRHNPNAEETPEFAGDEFGGRAVFDITGRQTTDTKDTKPPNDYYQSSWKRDGVNTEVTIVSPSKFEFNPYKSIHHAAAAICLPGMIYAWRKDRQIKCMYASCLQKSIGAGISTTHCEQAMKERHCLYVEGAEWKAHGTWGSLFEHLWQTALASLVSMITGMIYNAVCGEGTEDFRGTYTCGSQSSVSCEAVGTILCGLMSVVIYWDEFKDVIHNLYNPEKYLLDEFSPDYCEMAGV